MFDCINLAGFCVFSPEFLMAGTWWKMQLFPFGKDFSTSSNGSSKDSTTASNGSSKDSTTTSNGINFILDVIVFLLFLLWVVGNISLFLFATRSIVKAKYSLAILRPRPPSSTSEDKKSATTTNVPDASEPTTSDEEKVHFVCHGTTKMFEASSGWGFLRFFPRRDLLTGPWAAQDEIRLEVIVSVVTGIHHLADTRCPGDLRISSFTSLQQNLGSLLVSGKDSDIQCSVTVGERDKTKPTIFKSHRLILMTRSTYFRIMLSHDFVEKSSGYVHVDYCRPSVFRQLLTYIYTGACDLSGIDKTEHVIGPTSTSIQSLEEDEEEKENRQESKKEAKLSNDDENEVSIAERRENSGKIRMMRAAKFRTDTSSSHDVSMDISTDAALELLCAADRFDVVITFFVRVCCFVGVR
jgi:hypothetical protein